MNAATMFAWWGLNLWVPSYLSMPTTQGGVGLSTETMSMFIVAMQVGMWFGYVTFGFISDAFGRRPTYVTYLLIASFLWRTLTAAHEYPMRSEQVMTMLIDLGLIAGHLLQGPLPATPGNEGVGRVLETGPDVTGVRPGDQVVLPLLSGSWRERLVVPAAGLVLASGSFDMTVRTWQVPG